MSLTVSQDCYGETENDAWHLNVIDIDLKG